MGWATKKPSDLKLKFCLGESITRAALYESLFREEFPDTVVDEI